MADTKISALTSATTPLAGTEVLPIVQSGTTKKVTVDNLTDGKTVSASKIVTPFVGANTSDGADTSTVAIGGGGAASSARGGTVEVRGNEASLGGLIDITSGNVANSYVSIQGRSSSSYVRFLTNATEAMRIFSSQGISIGDQTDPSTGNLRLATGNLVIGTAGKGIDFSATSHAAGMTSELLSDYEEGTWTPQVYYQNATDQSTATDTAQYGWYTKVGRQVTITFQLTFSQATATGSLANDNIGVKNFPFTGQSGTGTSRIGGAVVSSMVTPTDANLYMAGGVTNCILVTPTNTSNLSNEVGTGSHTIYGTLTYFTA